MTMPPTPAEQLRADPAENLTLEEQLRAAYGLVAELHSLEVRLRDLTDNALETLRETRQANE